MQKACQEAKSKGFLPISAVDDLTIHQIGPWIDTFAKCLSRLAQLQKISIVGGEMAQMKDSYSPGYVGFVISVVSIKK
jgi:phosphoribosylaminoimidazole (AIR) synthetase